MHTTEMQKYRNTKMQKIKMTYRNSNYNNTEIKVGYLKVPVGQRLSSIP